MDKWGVSCNGTDRYFDTFQEAVIHFKTEICIFANQIHRNLLIPDPMPFDAGCFFSYKFDWDITDEEIVVYTRLTMLLGSLHIQNTEECSKYCSRVIRDPIDYRGRIEEFKEELDIKIDRSDNEITAEIAHRETGDDTFLSTNAFILREDQKSYYYKTHQIIRVTHANESYLLGTSVDLDLTLKHVTEEE